MLFNFFNPRKRTFLLKILTVVTFLCLIGVWYKSEDASRKSEVQARTDNFVSVTNLPKPNNNHVPSNDDILERVRAEKLISKFEKKFVFGLGEGGQAVKFTGDEAERATEIMKKEAFNLIASNKISLNRTVPDTRDPLCKELTFDSDLPSASVIIIFMNEALSALLRTVWSVLNRSPSQHLKEIILVDDFSDRAEVGELLTLYIKYRYPVKVRIMRLPSRHGLIRARIEGAKAAQGDVLIFLDSHCETNVKWMEPLLQRIKEERKAVLVPIIEVIDDKTLEYYAGNGRYFQVGGFTWSGHFTWIEVSEAEKQRRGGPVAPTRTPTMAGGLFAMDRNYFWELGSYDDGMDVWGGENLEMSFRIWMCGGLLETIPCSKVGHIFRSFHPYSFPGNKDTHGLNTARVAEVWMDDYKRLFYMYRPELQTAEWGDVSERKELRRRLQCNDFKWYLKNLLPRKFILDEEAIAYGKVRNPNYGDAPSLCLDHLQRDEKLPFKMGLYHCHKFVSSSQFMSLSKKGQLRREEMCAEVSDGPKDKEMTVNMVRCIDDRPQQLWAYTKEGQLIHNATNRCLDRTNKNIMQDVITMPCNKSPAQQWWFDHRTSDTTL